MSQRPAPKAQLERPRLPPQNGWATRLTRLIIVEKGPYEWLLSLDDARTYLLKHLNPAKLNDPLDRAIELLIRAADTGRLADREAATSQVELVLNARHWL